MISGHVTNSTQQNGEKEIIIEEMFFIIVTSTLFGSNCEAKRCLLGSHSNNRTIEHKSVIPKAQKEHLNVSSIVF